MRKSKYHSASLRVLPDEKSFTLFIALLLVINALHVRMWQKHSENSFGESWNSGVPVLPINLGLLLCIFGCFNMDEFIWGRGLNPRASMLCRHVLQPGLY